jgi:hypothetical protein
MIPCSGMISMFNGFNLGCPLPTSMNLCGFGNNKVCQACNSINVSHGGLGSNVEA